MFNDNSKLDAAAIECYVISKSDKFNLRASYFMKSVEVGRWKY